MKIEQYEVAKIDKTFDLIRTFQLKRLSQLCNVLMVRKNGVLYMVKCRPNYEKYIHTEEFKEINKYDLSICGGIENVYQRLDSKIQSIIPENRMVIFDM